MITPSVSQLLWNKCKFALLILPQLRVLTSRFRSDHAFKSSSYLYESLKDERTKGSGAAEKAAFSLAYNTDLSFFSWIQQPENVYAVKRFATAMHSIESLHYDDQQALGGLPA